MHFNVRSLPKNIDHLVSYLTELSESSDVIAVTETKLNNDTVISNIQVTGYEFVHCNSLTTAGGVGLYIKVVFKERTDISINLPFVEDAWIEIKTHKGPAVVGVVYRHPTTLTGDYETFSERLYDVFYDLNCNHIPFTL